jgi:predicted TIM-barrel fold metal-dependent hydrolase
MTTTAPERLISADDHVDLSHESVKRHLASRFHDDYDAGIAAFRATMTSTASIAANQRWREQEGLEPDPTVSMGSNRSHAAFGRPGHTDPQERLRDMDADGVEASSSYCEVSSFRYLYLIENGWKEATRAFNSALAEFAAADPKRLVVSYQIPIHDIEAAVDEVRWAASVGCRSLQLPVFPAELGLPDYWERRYDPLFSAIQETGLPICCHIGLNTQLDDLARRDPTPQKGIFVPMVGLSTAEAFGMWIMGGVFERFPDLKLVFVETTLGWIPWYMYTADDLVQRQHYDFPRISEPPSHYFKKNIWLTFIDEPQAIRDDRYDIGVDRIMWSSDYPHPVSSWPNSRALAEEQLKDIPEEEKVLITSLNAAHVWNL